MKIVIYGAGDIASIVATEFFEDHDIIVIDPDIEKLNQFPSLIYQQSWVMLQI